jgi:hypothetical protein
MLTTVFEFFSPHTQGPTQQKQNSRRNSKSENYIPEISRSIEQSFYFIGIFTKWNAVILHLHILGFVLGISIDTCEHVTFHEVLQ